MAVRLVDLDQRSWLQAMGDPNPIGLVDVHSNREGDMLVGGRTAALYTYEGESHSDIGNVHTPLREHLSDNGRGPPTLTPFHELTLRGDFALFVDKLHRVAVMVYSAAPVYKTADGKIHDHYAQLQQTFKTLMKSVHIRSTESVKSAKN